MNPIYRGGPNYPLPYMIEGAPLELYRTHAHQARPDILGEGLQRFIGAPGQERRWLPARMAQQQWKKGPGGRFQPATASVDSYLSAVAASQHGGSMMRVGRISPERRRMDAFQDFADRLMHEGAWRMARKPGAQAAVRYPSSPAVSRNIPGPQLLPDDLHALQVYEEAAMDAARYSKARQTRSAINAIRAADAHYAALTGGRRFR